MQTRQKSQTEMQSTSQAEAQNSLTTQQSSNFTLQTHIEDHPITTSISTDTLTCEREDEFITEEIIKDIGWKIYSSHEQELRSRLHIEYLGKYKDENLIPRGLKIKVVPSIQDETLVEEWNNVLKKASCDLMNILIKHHEKKVLELSVKRNDVNAEMDRFWDQEEKTEFVQDIKEELVPREKALRDMKDGKLERDRLEAKLDGKSKRIQGDKAVRKPYSKMKYSDIVKRHIKEQLNNSPKSTESHKISRSRYTRDHNKEHEN